MGLGFLVPAFLAGLAALLVPIILHLRHRERDKPRRFPSLMFLRRIPIRTARRRRITDWFLLALRAGVVAALVAAFTRPFLGRAVTTAGTTPGRAVVLLLDRSLSMSHRAVWPAALDSARRIVASLRPADRVAVVLFDEEAEVAVPLSSDGAAALAAIEAARPVARGTRYAAGLRAARQILATEAAWGRRGEILVVTDLQRSGLQGLAGLELPADVPVRAVAVTPPTRANAAIVGADVERVPDGERTKLVVAARLSARDLGGPRKTRVALTVNGRSAGSREVTLPADGALTVGFDPVPLPAGRVQATIALQPDDLVADDSLHFVVPAEQGLRVVLVAPGDARADETLFLERALAIGRAPRITVERRVAGTALDARVLRGAGVVMLFDSPVPAGGSGAALSTWIRDGGGLVQAVGRRTAARPVASPILPGTVKGAIERMQDRGGGMGGGGAFGEVSLDHPIFAAFKDDGGAALGSARFLRYARIEPDSGAEVLARFDDGAPALLTRRQGRGEVLMVAAPLDALLGDFPLQPAYLPFLRRLTLYATGHAVAPLWRETGEIGIVPQGVKEPVVKTPVGRLLRPASDSGGTGRGGGPCAVVLGDAGFYEVYEGRAAGDPLEVFAANAPAGESDLTPADPRELLLGVRRSDSTATVGAEPPTNAEREGRQRLWRTLLALAGLLLIVEMIVANRGWRATAPTVTLPVSKEGSSS